MIDSFKGKYSFLSNFYNAEITYQGISYLNNEAAFQAQKTTDDSVKKEFSELEPACAKKKGRKVSLRKDWEDVKFDIMYEICKTKFTQHPELAELLIATGSEELVEGNNWGDITWGKVNGKGKNYLGKILMKIREEFMEENAMSYSFNAENTTNELVKWIQDYFKENASPETKAVIGISGGKDSSVAAALCVKALGKDRVVGILMPQGEQSDISFSRLLVDHLDIENYTINIGETVSAIKDEISKNFELSRQAVVNTPARIRMTTLYAVAACKGGRVVNTCNLSEDWVGYSTKFGDSAGDFSPLSDLTVTEVLQIGEYLGLPAELVHKTPTDGLSGLTDEENLGFTYAELDNYIRGLTDLADKPELKEKIDRLHKYNLHKLMLMPKFELK